MMAEKTLIPTRNLMFFIFRPTYSIKRPLENEVSQSGPFLKITKMCKPTKVRQTETFKQVSYCPIKNVMFFV